jgi:hypothetical protein
MNCQPWPASGHLQPGVCYSFGPSIGPHAVSWWTLPHWLILAGLAAAVIALTWLWPGPPAWLRDRAAGLLAGCGTRMSRADAARWKSARTMADLGGLVIAWMLGEITQTPGHCGPPDEETYPLIPSLTILNRGGFVTDNSQLAETADDGRAWNTWVSGFAPDEVLERIREACDGTGLQVSACRDHVHDCHWRRGLGFFWACPWRECAGFWADRCPSVAGELRDCWFVVIEDPEVARNDLLWPVLEKALSEVTR